MSKNNFLRLHWRLFFPLVGLLWLIIGVTMCYFVTHEKQRLKYNLENRLLNVNNTVIEAYEHGADLQNTVDFIRLFTDNTALAPLRITVYDQDGVIIADNPQATISLFDSDGHMRQELKSLWNQRGNTTLQDMSYNDTESMICSETSADGRIHTFAALPYEDEVVDFLSYDSTVWIVVILLGVVSSVIAYLGVRAVCSNVYTLRDFAQAIASDNLPDDTGSWHFSKDELGEVSRNLVRLYRDKIHAEQEKTHHEHQIAINISHELNTPVSIVKGYIDTVMDNEKMPEEIRHNFLMRAQQNINRLVHLVNDIRTVTRLEGNKETIPTTDINFYQLASHIAEDIRQGHVADMMTFEYEIPEDCKIRGHESLLTNALLNLAYNAGKYSNGTKMSLRWLYEDNGYHVFTFSDDGVGVGEEHLARLFDLLYRVDSGRARKNGGTGLGLPLVKRIFTAIGGSISVTNGAEGGLEFTFSIPSVK